MRQVAGRERYVPRARRDSHRHRVDLDPADAPGREQFVQRPKVNENPRLFRAEHHDQAPL
jgi:hypothetical protein